jgi:hypothetical protein
VPPEVLSNFLLSSYHADLVFLIYNALDIPTHMGETPCINKTFLVKNSMSQGQDIPFKLSQGLDNKNLADHSFLTSDDAINVWSLTSTTLYAFVMRCSI